MSVSTCRHCGDQIIQTIRSKDEMLRWIHTRTGETKCPIRWATPVESLD